VPGIVINAARTRPKAVMVTVRCKNCNTERQIHCPNGMGGIALPRTCTGQQANFEDNAGNAPPAATSDQKCPIDPFVIIPDRCKYVDQQLLKLQELPEDVPTGEMPRHIPLHVERILADRIAPGTRVSVLAVGSIHTDTGPRGAGPADRAVRKPYLRVVGVTVGETGSGRATASFTPEEEARLMALAKLPNVYDVLSRSVAPSISGDYTEDIKRAILCLLLGGSRRLLADGARLRGDINVLLLGDPSTAKSQFLKFVEKVAPVGVYTSGKGSSAAGLTASVIRDARGEFYLEGGAMVLADGGVVCIDEFDKMREEDRVAIHEAMEQQTISVAKAGITTILNSRCSVLAAANPVFGRYDDARSAADNIDLLPTILSRFDLIFIVRDIRDEKRDMEIARHVVSVHVNATGQEDRAGLGAGGGGGGAGGAGGGGGTDGDGTDIDVGTMKKFISYVRSKCAPTLTAGAHGMLQNKYAEIRHANQQRELEAGAGAGAGGLGDKGGGGSSHAQGVIPITVRQLEALIRITESVAKASLSVEANEAHVEEALRLFNVSTLTAAASGVGVGEVLAGQLAEKVKRAEVRIQRLLDAPGSTRPVSAIAEALAKAGYENAVVVHALRIMERREEIALLSERRVVKRLK
jgi:DNA replication licensing factor MCM5